jgi:cyanophycinase
MSRKKGDLIIIGGNEQKSPDAENSILKEVASAASGKGRLVVLTVASEIPEEVAETYRATFGKLGVKHVDVLDIRTREQAYDAKNVEKVSDASVLFFTGGDQLRITSQMGGSPVLERIFALHEDGVTIVGTSAGAAASSETMLIGGSGNESRIAGLAMAPGLGLIKGAIVDSHFAQRGRFGRLLGAVAQNPHNLGIGIDEDTALYLRNDKVFTVLGAGAVYVFDGTGVSYTNLSERVAEGVITVHDVRVHVLAKDSRFDLQARRPLPPSGKKREDVT